jgi:hypothetical protein
VYFINTEIYRNIVFLGCETWSLILREETRLRVFENRALRRIFGTKRSKVTGEWRKLHSEELNNVYCSPNIFRAIKSKRMRWARHVACMGKGEVHVGFWRGKRGGKIPFGKPRLRWEDDIKMKL